MQTFLYVIWFLIPIFFFGVALWSKLEQLSGRNKHENPMDFVKQGGFVLICSVLSVLVDQYAISTLNEESLPSWLPLTFIRIVLFPVVLYAAAVIIGPTKEIRIEKPGHPSQKNRRLR